jgi:hypothetical protein
MAKGSIGLNWLELGSVVTIQRQSRLELKGISRAKATGYWLRAKLVCLRASATGQRNLKAILRL